MLKVCIVGLGAIGGWVAAHLQRAEGVEAGRSIETEALRGLTPADECGPCAAMPTLVWH